MMTRNMKYLHKNKDDVFKYWENSARKMERENHFYQLKTKKIFDHTWITTVRAFLEEGHIKEGDTILDAGCGWGRILSGIKYFIPNTTVIGIDQNRTRLEASKRILEDLKLKDNVILEVCDVDHLSFPSNSFDVVVSARLLQYVPDPIHTLKELNRILKPGGHLVITVPNKFNPIRLFTYSRILYSPSAVKRWFIESGMSDISCRTISFIPTYKRMHWQSKWLSIEKLQRIPMLNYMGGLVLCAGSKN
jgi:ubiquinone/menaquinone biosynthesis C-methylase UbiE